MEGKSASSKLHGRTIKYNQISKISDRNAYLAPETFEEVNTLIRKNSNLMFMPSALHETHLQDKKYEKAKYKIILWGVLEDGRRATVVLNGIQPYFEVLIPDELPEGDTHADFADELFEKLKGQSNMEPVKYEINTGRQFKYFSKAKKYYARFYFNKSTFRKNAIKYVRLETYPQIDQDDDLVNMKTVHDDLTCYYRVVCRDRFMSFTSWNVLSEYSVGTNKSLKGSVFNVDVHSGGYTAYEGDISENPNLVKDKTMTMTWDIETFSPDGRLPIPSDPSHKLFMIGITFHWYHSDGALLKVCLVDKPCKPHKDYITIVCDTEERVIKSFGKIFEKMKPEFLVGFNDSDYDWIWLIKRASQTPGLLTYLAKCLDFTKPWRPYCEEDLLKYNFTQDKVKVEADTYAEGRTFQFPGYINLDVRTIFRQLYPTAEKSSLNWFLEKNKLGGKKDMPYQEMFKIYRRMHRHMTTGGDDTDEEDENDFAVETRKCQTVDALSERMREVAEYCVIDAQRCHELMKMRYVIMDRRAVSKVAYTSLYEAFYRANGSKVRNLVIARGQKLGLKISNISEEYTGDPGKYPGGFVFAPRKGLVTSKLTIRELKTKALQFQADEKSLTGNMKEWLTISEEELEMYEEFISEYNPCIDFKTDDIEVGILNELAKNHIPKCVKNFFSEKTGRPITGLDFSSLYPSLIMTYNLSPEYMVIDRAKARALDSEGYKLHKIKFVMGTRTVRAWSVSHENKIDPKQADYRFGIYPQILKELFDTRKQMKVGLHHWEGLKEKMEGLPAAEFNLSENQKKYENIVFQYNSVDSKQKALKVFMNTFYGETGNKRSPFFLLELAGGITSMGQKNVKAANDLVTEMGCVTQYGDTDSIYLGMPHVKFIDIDRKYYSGKMTKLDYWKELVNITFKEIQPVRDIVNNWFFEDNGTRFLRMAFEEALFPVTFLAKKKYYGIPHISVPNFNYKYLFIRGLEIKKRGVSQFLRSTCQDIMDKSVDPKNLYSLLELIHNQIHHIYASEYDFKDFIMTDVYKPNKQNTKVQTFARRMRERGIKVKPWERFTYVIVKKNPFFYDHRGRKKSLQVGDKMEYATEAQEKKMEIDMDYYMQGSINGQLARLIIYHSMFHVEPEDDSIDEQDIAEKKIYGNAVKYVDNFCKSYYTNYQSKGKIYQKVFNIANKVVSKKLKEVYDHSGIVDIIGNGCDRTKLESWLCNKAEKEAVKESKGYGQLYVESQVRNAVDESSNTADYENSDEEEVSNKRLKSQKIKELQLVYFANHSNLSKTRETQFRQRLDILKRNIQENIDGIQGLYSMNQTMIESLSGKIKNIIKIDEQFNESGDIIPNWEDIAEVENIDEDELDEDMDTKVHELIDNKNFWKTMNKLKFIYINLVSNYVFIYKTRSIVEHLKVCRNKETKTYLGKGFNKKKHISDSVNDMIGKEKF
jgi:DNA polymerase elongation subunit (family B)